MLNLEPTTIKLLNKKGFDTSQKALSFLYPSADMLSSPYLLNGMEEAKKKVLFHVKNNSSIVIYGDYDCDGIGALAILYHTIKHLGGNVNCFIPVRADDGYGLSPEGIAKAVELYNPNLIITVDCGISCVNEVAELNGSGIDVIITDHHEPKKDLPNTICLNPKTQKNDLTEGLDLARELSGAGVAFKLAEVLTDLNFALQFADILAISTIADLVPLTGDNRIFASLGLKLINENPCLGLKTLINTAGCKLGAVTSYDIAYKIAPRLNASGRLSSAQKSLKLLVETDENLLMQLALQLEDENRERQEILAKTVCEAKELLKGFNLIDNNIIVLYNEHWEAGVVGIAAARLMQEFCRPTVLLTKKDGFLKGSCRSISGVNIIEVLQAVCGTLVTFGGHTAAAGLTLKEQNLADFIKKANEYIKNTADREVFLPKQNYDLEICFDDINLKLAREISLFEPFGMQNPRPVFLNVCNSLPFLRMSPNKTHLKCMFNGFSMVAFDSLNKLSILKSDMQKHLFFTVEKGYFGQREVINCVAKSVQVVSFNAKEEGLRLNYENKKIPIEPLANNRLPSPISHPKSTVT
jgi:single-stranded-DNA-specific exonuclease